MHRQENGSTASKLSRKVQEKNRRMHMSCLTSRLAYLILPQSTTKDKKRPIHKLLDQAATYVKQLQERIDEMKQRKEVLKSEEVESTKSPKIIITERGSHLEVNLVTSRSSNKKFMLHEVISILQEEGAEVVSASHSTTGNRVFSTVHSQPIISRIGIATSTVQERLKKVVGH